MDTNTRHLLELPRLPPYRLESNELGPDGAKALAPALAANASITSLSLGRNELGDKGATVLARALKYSKVSKLASLDLNGVDCINKIGPAGAKELAAYLTVSASLTNLE